MSHARQTIVRVRGDDSAISAEVTSLLPSLAAKGRKAARRSQKPGVRTTFCPICGRPKTLGAMRCANCRDEAQRRHAAAAKVAGHHSIGRAGAARSLATDDAIKANPERVRQIEDGPTWSRRVKGAGQVRTQPWARKVLVDGQWVLESETPEGRERAETDAAAIARLRNAR